MKKITIIITILLSLNICVNGQIFPDSLKTTFISKIKTKDTITIYISRENCFRASFEKFKLTNQDNNYKLIAYCPIPLHNRLQLNNNSLDTINFKLLNTYNLSDSNIIAFAQIEKLGQRCGNQSRGSGEAIGIYKLKFKKRIKEFSNKCFSIKDLEKIAFPETYYEECDNMESK